MHWRSGRSRHAGTTTPPLLLVGHGTRSQAGVAAFDHFTHRLATRLDPLGIPVAGGFIELSPPPLTDAVRGLHAAGHTSLVAIPMMLVAAGHAKGDVPAALARELDRHPGLRYTYGRPLGTHPHPLEALTERLDAVLPPTQRADTTVLLVGRASTDPDADSDVFRAARLFAEGRALAGVEAAFISLAPPGVPAALERRRRLGARRIIVLPYFLFPGVLPDRITAQAHAWAGEHPGIDVRTADVTPPSCTPSTRIAHPPARRPRRGRHRTGRRAGQAPPLLIHADPSAAARPTWGVA